MILLNPATPIVRTALKYQNDGGNGPWQETIDLIHSYLWACFVALGGGEMVIVDTGLLRPVDDLKGECELLIRKASNWESNGSKLVNPTAARFTMIHVYRLLLHFKFIKEPVIVERATLIDLEDLIIVI